MIYICIYTQCTLLQSPKTALKQLYKMHPPQHNAVYHFVEEVEMLEQGQQPEGAVGDPVHCRAAGPVWVPSNSKDSMNITRRLLQPHKIFCIEFSLMREKKEKQFPTQLHSWNCWVVEKSIFLRVQIRINLACLENYLNHVVFLVVLVEREALLLAIPSISVCAQPGCCQQHRIWKANSAQQFCFMSAFW